ncbi:hypothetical protein [Clostridium botulinum]|uniref:hypothetical protein n=2 Tax=Clostridium botulinum TaxID=1491 RepID=UPI001FA73024|nr:hypothetical protein [Clostridium botulinum]
MGHIMRTLVFVEKLKENHNVFYACRMDESLKVQSEGYINKFSYNLGTYGSYKIVSKGNEKN